MELDFLLGTWRTTKIHYHSDYFEDFGEADQWLQYTIKSGGEMYQSRNYKGTVSAIAASHHIWRFTKGQIIFTENERWDYKVTELTENTMVVRSETTGITWYYQRVTEKTP